MIALHERLVGTATHGSTLNLPAGVSEVAVATRFSTSDTNEPKRATRAGRGEEEVAWLEELVVARTTGTGVVSSDENGVFRYG
jgi:hypothetical protein